MFKRLLIWALLVLPGTALLAQSKNLSDYKLDKLYNGWLDEVLDEVGKETGVQFEFDREKLTRIGITNRAFNKALDKWLTDICKEDKLKWYQTTDGVVHIIGLYENPETKAMMIKSNQNQVAATRSDITIKGTVYDASSGEALPFVTVRVAGAPIGSNSNVDGYFTVLHVPSDTSTLIFNYIGYRNATIYLSPGAPLDKLVIEMEPSGTELGEVVISAEREDLLQITEKVSMLKMSTQKLALLPSLGEKDIFRAFQLMPGVSGSNEQTAGLYVRGGTPDQALTLFDGFTVYNVDHLFGFYSAFNANSIKDVQLYKSAFDAKYGGRLSSVVEITGKDGNNRSFNAGGELGMLSANFWMEQPFSEKWTTVFAVRRSWRGPIYNKIFNKFKNSTTSSNTEAQPGGNNRFSGTSVSSWFFDMNAKSTWKPNKRDIISLSFYSGKDKLDNSQSPNLPSGLGGGRGGLEFTDLTDWGNTGASLKWSARWNKKLYSNSLISYSTYFSNRDRTTEGSFMSDNDSTISIRRGTLEHNRLQDFSARQDWEWKITDQQQIEFGAAATYNDVLYNFSQNDTSSILDQHNSGTTLTAYLQDKVTLFHEKLAITPGLRETWFSPTGQFYLEPRFNVSYQMTPRIKLKAAAGQYHQFVKRVVREDILSGSRDFWVLADDERLPVSSSEQYVGGFSWENKDYLLDVEGYYKPLHGLSEYSLRVNARPGAPGSGGGNINYEENFYDGNGIAKGIDFLFQKKSGKWNGWVGYTLGSVRHNFPVYGVSDFYATHDVTHEFKCTNMYKWRHWDFSATWIYATGKPYTAPEGAYTIELLDGTTQDFLNVSAKNAYRLPAYHRMDLAATYNFHFGNAPASLNTSIFNVYGRKNVWYKQFEVVDSQLITSDVNYLGFTPNMTLSIKLR